MKKVELNKNWKFKIISTEPSFNKYLNIEEWRDASVPGTVHTDLLNSGLIANPFYEDNETKLQWINACDWEYTTSFDYPGEFKNQLPVNLIFEGLDTFADIFLNGISISKCENMFRSYEIDVTSIIKSANNQLLIAFSSPIRESKLLEEKYGKLYVEVNTERIYARKAQYSFGWDWGPSFPTVGIYKPVYLQQKNSACIKGIKFNTIEILKTKATVEVNIDIGGSLTSDICLEVNVSLYGKLIKGNVVNDVSGKNQIKIEIDNPLLWWPCCLGDQPLYQLDVILKTTNNQVLEKQKRKVGIRIVRLALKEEGRNTFKFLINEREIFIKGVNWIPADSFLPRVSKKKYNRLLWLAKNANCNMIRVWGGGTYEQNIFYELCDEYGLLVWQDFMFACGSYPEYDGFLENITVEIEQNVARLQYHPSIALWCGNNECEWIWYQKQTTDISKLPGYNIYHKLIPRLLKEIDTLRPYWPSSPFGYDEDPNDQNSGNTHQWNIWSYWIDYTEVIKDNSLFVSEFGFQAPANRKTWEKALSKENLNCDNSIFDFHNKQIDGQKRILKFMSDHLPVSCKWDDYIYLAQLNQGFALKSCIEHWISNRPTTNGAIIWQLNDCWPAVSWSIIDSDLKPKLAYYFVKNSFAPQLLYFKKKDEIIDLMLLNQNRDNIISRIRLAIIDTISGAIVEDLSLKVESNSNYITQIVSLPYKRLPDNKNWILTAVLYNQSGQIISKNYYLEKPWKQIQLREAEVDLDIIFEDETAQVVLNSHNPVFFIDLYHPEYIFSDRGFFILPEEKITLDIIGKVKKQIDKNEIKIYSLNNYLS